MLLKKYLFILFIGFSFIGFAQNKGGLNSVRQSSVEGNAGASYAVDGNVELYSTARTKKGNNSWWELDLEDSYLIQGIDITSPAPLTDVYVIISAESIFPESSDGANDYDRNALFIDGLIDQDATIMSLDQIGSTNVHLPFNAVGQFISLVHAGWGDLGVTEVGVIKAGPFGPGGPFVGGGGYTHQASEICNDGKDNDKDGFVDCDDYDCKVKNVNIWYTEPSCPICIDGEICINAYPVSKVSLDGGATWSNFSNGNCFTVGDGVYDIVLESPGGCTVEETITFSSSTGTDRTPCLNGGYENGNFENWTGGLKVEGMSYTSEGPHNFTNQDFAINDRHTIINNDGFQDPIVGNLIGPGQGQYFTKLGNLSTLAGNNEGPHELERLTYCLVVDDPDFAFMYAQVMEDPSNDHDPEQLPFFAYNITDTDGNELAAGLITSDDEYLVDFDGIIRYRGWTCERIDLKDFIDQQVCINFINSDCSLGAHGGYTYIDEVCATPADFTPIVDLNSCSDAICGDMVFEIDAPAGFYNEYSWIIAQIDQNGNRFGVKQFDKEIGYVAHLDDLKLFYESNSNFTFQCNSQIEVTLEVYNGCGTSSATDLFDYNCVDYTIDYCNTIILCGTNTNTQIIGLNDCVGCTYKWQPASRLVDASVKFPIVDVENFADSYSKTYSVEVTTPEGCIIKDEVTFVDNGGFALVVDSLDIGYCGFNVSGRVNLTSLNSSLTNDKIVVTAMNLINGTSQVLPVTGTGLSRTFANSYDRTSDKHILIIVELFLEDMECTSVATCSQSFMFDEVKQTTYHAYWKAAFPNIITPNQPQNNKLKVFFSSLEENEGSPDCEVMNTGVSSIYYYKMDVFDYWGQHLFSQEVQKSIFDTEGITGNEIEWDGTFNGEEVANGNYSVMITTNSCFPGNFECYNCGGLMDDEECTDSPDCSFPGDCIEECYDADPDDNIDPVCWWKCAPYLYQYCTGVDSDVAQQGTPGGTDQDNPDLFSFLVYVENGGSTGN